MSNLCITYLILLDHFVIIFNLDLFLTAQAGSRHLIKCCPLKPLSLDFKHDVALPWTALFYP